MLKRLKNIFLLSPFFILAILMTKYYLSEKNKIFTDKSRTFYQLKPSKNIENLILLKNDTNNIIIYKDELEDFNKKRKKRIWETLIND